MSIRRLALIFFIPIPILVAAVLLGLGWRTGLFYNWTGEEKLLSQVKGLTDLSSDLLRPRLQLANDTPAAHSGVNPFGVNVFLEQEPDPAVRERVVQMAKEAGYHWLRQEFPWEDIEIHGKGDFEDRRHEPYRSAWEKYDNIVDLAEQNGMELIVRVSNPPEWTRAVGDSVGTFAPPDDYQDYADFVSALVSRYKGRIKYYQLWNEPNIYPEWGNNAISPEDYTRLLCTAAAVARRADPSVVIINGALASTIVLSPQAAPPGNALNDFLFLQRLYDAGAKDCFDVVAMQGYGLWSGPTDRRMNPRVIDFSRPLFVRDIMVTNGDAHKPIWISEMNWNAVPEAIPDKRFGQVTEEQQARYLPLAYDRLQKEWPWLGVANTWFFKRPDFTWQKENKPEYYFRVVEPDFTPLPVFQSMKTYANAASSAPVMYPGAHAPDHWAVQGEGYRTQADPQAALGMVGVLPASETVTVRFDGASLRLLPAVDSAAVTLQVAVDGAAPQSLQAEPGQELRIKGGRGVHTASITASDELKVDHWYVKDGSSSQLFFPLLCCFTSLLVLYFALVARALSRRRRTGQH